MQMLGLPCKSHDTVSSYKPTKWKAWLATFPWESRRHHPTFPHKGRQRDTCPVSGEDAERASVHVLHQMHTLTVTPVINASCAGFQGCLQGLRKTHTVIKNHFRWGGNMHRTCESPPRSLRPSTGDLASWECNRGPKSHPMQGMWGQGWAEDPAEGRLQPRRERLKKGKPASPLVRKRSANSKITQV